MHYELEKVTVIDSNNILNKYDSDNKEYYTKRYFRVLFNDGVNLINEFLKLNNLGNIIIFINSPKRSSNSFCGWYEFDTNELHIILDSCARMNPMYSYPNFTSNRTPQGVLVHEFGHYLSSNKYKPYKYSNSTIKNRIQEKCITSYCPNSDEWMAEMLKLFITNPDLLKNIRPNTYKEFIKYWKPLNRGMYKEVLNYPLGNIPDRIQKRLDSKLKEVK